MRTTEVDETLKRCSRQEIRNAWTPSSSQVADARDHRKVVQKFVIQLEAQLADRHVTIEIRTRRPTGWQDGFDELTAPGQVARASRSTSRSRVADEILFGRSSRAATSRWCSRTPTGLRDRGRGTRTRSPVWVETPAAEPKRSTSGRSVLATSRER